MHGAGHPEHPEQGEEDKEEVQPRQFGFSCLPQCKMEQKQNQHSETKKFSGWVCYL